MSWDTSNRRSRLPADWPAIRQRILIDPDTGQPYLCRICGTRRATDVDHIVAGDDHADDNLQPLCWICHRRKSSAEGNAARRRFPEKRPRPKHPGIL